MRLKPIVTILAVAAASALATACATAPFDELYEARDYTAAARVFQDDPSLQTDARTLYRAAMIHASPHRPTYDAEAARELLQRLLIAHPGSDYDEDARRTLALLDELKRREDDVVRLAAEAGTLTAEVERLRQLIDRLDERAEQQAEQIELLGQVVQRLEIEIRARDRRIRALQDELDQLKAIDLRPIRAPVLQGEPVVRPDSTRPPPRDSTPPEPVGAGTEPPDSTGPPPDSASLPASA